jgi:(2R)-3-sulfolactate dehydrogenase (NADP+)
LARLHCLYPGNTPKAIAPFGAKEKVLGTNPVAFAAPGEEDPLVIDFAVSAVARGKIRTADRAGQNIPCGWASGLDGEPTTDPQTAFPGTMVPIGGAKGAALALLVEVMSACLAGAALSIEAGSLFEGAGDPPNLGLVFLAIDAQALSAHSFSSPLKDLAAAYDRIQGAWFTGLKRLQNRKIGAVRGAAVPAALLKEILDLARCAGLGK